MSDVSLGIPYFPDPTKGKPVFNGSIFVGEPDTDPEVEGNQKQITLIQEDGTKVNVSQPVKTGAGGVPMYNGSPVRITVDNGFYSLKILNNAGSQVYYLFSSADYLNFISHPVRVNMSTANTTISVDVNGGGDFTSLQEAINQIPMWMAHTYRFNVADGTYDEDIVVPAFYFERIISQAYDSNTKGFLDGLEIVGNDSNPSNVKIKSIVWAGGQTFRTKFQGFEITSGSPYADQNAALEVRRGVEVVLRNLKFTDTTFGTRAMSAYGGTITVKEGVDIGSNLFSGPFVAKVGGSLQIASNQPLTNPNSGTATGNLFGAQDGTVVSVESDPGGATPFELAQFSTSGDNFASTGGMCMEWIAGQKAILHDTKFANDVKLASTQTTDANGQFTIAHGLDSTPTYAQVSIFHAAARVPWGVKIRGLGSTNITVYIDDGAGGDLATTEVTVMLEAAF